MPLGTEKSAVDDAKQKSSARNILFDRKILPVLSRQKQADISDLPPTATEVWRSGESAPSREM
jgi:hypothetical protein